MKNLPVLLKQPNKKYFIGCDIAREGSDETFTFCVMFKEDEILHVQQCESVINRVEYKVDSPTQRYIDTLEFFYNNQIRL